MSVRYKKLIKILSLKNSHLLTNFFAKYTLFPDLFCYFFSLLCHGRTTGQLLNKINVLKTVVGRLPLFAFFFPNYISIYFSSL